MSTILSITLSKEAFEAFVPANAKDPVIPQRVLIDAHYTEDARPTEERTADTAPEAVPRSVRVTLDSVGTVAVDVGEPLNDTLMLALLKSDGSTVRSHVVGVENSKARYVITITDVKALVKSEEDPVVATTRRNARNAQLIPIGSVTPNFKRSKLAIITINKEAEIAANSPLGPFAFSKDRTSSVEVDPAMATGLQAVTWAPVTLGVDGRFIAVFDQPLSKPGGDAVPSLGWVWWLSGERSAAGFVKDDVSKPDRSLKLIPLPAIQAQPGATAGDPDCDCDAPGKQVSLDVTEAELINNPDIYSEDPGTFCKPFSNPERVIGEKVFGVIARVEQPDISPLPSARLKSVQLLNLEPEDDTVVEPPRPGRPSVVVLRPPTAEMMHAALLATRPPVRHVEPPHVVHEIQQMPSGRTLMSPTQPVQWEDHIAQYQAATVALGHILEFRVRTRAAGYSLGNVASTLTLAPRQTKRIQKVEFERVEKARREEQTQQTDNVSDELRSERDYDDNVSAGLSEWAKGSSSSGTAAAAGGFGFAIGPIIGGAGGGTSKAWSESSQSGERNVSASEQQRLRDSIRRHGDALRRFQSTVVTEVTQQETVTGTTEILRNPNYGHSLTVIYYQILRHLAVSTEFAGVRECLFVPFAIKPFTVQRAYRWREAIQKYLRLPRLAKAVKHLRDVVTEFKYSDLAAGTRADQRLTYMRGSLYVRLAIERPKDGEDGKYDAAQWLPYSSFFGMPAYGIWAKLAERNEAVRDQYFQKEHAPTIARKWADKLVLNVNGKPINADFTLASTYGFNQVVRIDFSVPGGTADNYTRAQLFEVIAAAGSALPAGSVANATRMTIRYGTANFERTIESKSGEGDLITPETGAIDGDGASLTFPLDSWDQVNEREVLKHSVNELVEHLNEHVEYYHKAIWWNMDRDRLFMMMDGFYVPNTNNVSIASVVDREPIAIMGNCLVYRVGAGAFLGTGKITTPAELYNQYAGREPAQDPLRISLPTDGLYAQTIMDECLALEEHQGSVDWVLNDPDPDLGTIDPSLMMTRRADVSSTLTPTQMPATIINLQNAPDAPAPTGLGGALGAVTNANSFRDMAGLAGTQANAAAALQTAASLATNFGNQAAALKMAELAKNKQATEDVNKKLAAIQKAKDQGLISDEDAADHTNKIIGGMHGGAAGDESVITGNDLAQQLIDSGRPGSISESNPTGTRVIDIPPQTIEASSQITGPDIHDGGDLLGGGNDASVDTSLEGLSECEKKIVALVDASPVVRKAWVRQGVAPLGYLRGMALTYGRMYCKLKAMDPFITKIAAKATTSTSKDALAFRKAKFNSLGLSNSADGPDTLRHVMVLLTGVGMLESSGHWCEGPINSNAGEDTKTSGMFQMSFSIGVRATSPFPDMSGFLTDLSVTNVNTGYLEVFKKDVPTCANLPASFPSTPQGDFRKFCIHEPASAAELAALGLRQRRAHWSTVDTAEIHKPWDEVLKQVQTAIDEGACCAKFAPTHMLDA